MSKYTDSLIRRIDRYMVQERIGTGGMARVYRALDTALKRDVAIKVLHDHLADDSTFRARFEREARFLASFNHPNVVQIFDYATMEANGEHLVYMVMTYLPGQSLADVMEAQQGDLMPQERVLKITQDLAAALDYAHELGMVHRDVKPANILFDGADRAVLTDFGISRMVENSNLTQENVAVGTPAYMAPEQAAGEDVDARTDIYALGVILYELLAGQPPFGNNGSVSVLLKHLNEPVPSLTELEHINNDYLDAVIFKTLAKDPNKRYQSAGEVAQDLERALANEKPALKEDIETLRTISMPAITAPQANLVDQSAQRRFSSPMGILMTGLTAILVLLISAFVIERFTDAPIATPAQPDVATLEPTLDPNDFRNFGGIDSMVEEPDAGIPSMTVQTNRAFVSEFDAEDPLLGGYWPLNVEAAEDREGMIRREQGDDDTYLFTNSIPNRAATTILMDYEYTDSISIVADVTLDADSPRSSGYGIVFHYHNPVNFGVFAVDGNGNFSIWYLIDGAWMELRDAPDGDWTRSDAVSQRGEPNRLRLDIRGTTLTGFVNGEQVTQIDNDALTEGGVGLYLATPSNGGEGILITDRYEVIVAEAGGMSSMTYDNSDPTPANAN